MSNNYISTKCRFGSKKPYVVIMWHVFNARPVLWHWYELTQYNSWRSDSVISVMNCLQGLKSLQSNSHLRNSKQIKNLQLNPSCADKCRLHYISNKWNNRYIQITFWYENQQLWTNALRSDRDSETHATLFEMWKLVFFAVIITIHYHSTTAPFRSYHPLLFHSLVRLTAARGLHDMRTQHLHAECVASVVRRRSVFGMTKINGPNEFMLKR